MKSNLITIFGATGNLTYKKLLPALYRLKSQNLLSEHTKIICIGRRNFTTRSFIEEAKIKVSGNIDWDVMSKVLFYYQMNFEELTDYNDLKSFIDKNCQLYADNSIFYLATAPHFFPIIAQGISEAKLVSKENLRGKIVFEKPFGEDLPTAIRYNQLLGRFFDESQIYRIDHYLGKEMIQNILVIRFANKIFEDIWSNVGIKSVKIIAKEKEGVMNRGGYYDEAGALKDMVQNHLMQMLTLIAMDPPECFETDDIREQKVKVIEKLKLSNTTEKILFGQYESYRLEKNVDIHSQTETFVFLKAEINSDRWRGVPFYILTGKNLDEKKSEIVIEFIENSHTYKKWPLGTIEANKLIIRVEPEDGITFQLNTKVPGLSADVKPVVMDYCHGCQTTNCLPEAYEKLLLDIIKGDTTLFTRWDEIEESWRFIDQVKNNFKGQSPTPYKSFNELKEKIKDEYDVIF